MNMDFIPDEERLQHFLFFCLFWEKWNNQTPSSLLWSLFKKGLLFSSY